MKKKSILGSIFALVIAAVATWNMSLNSKSGNLSGLPLLNVEVLAYGEGVEDCPITQYTRNAKEQYVTTTVQYNAGGGYYAMVGPRKVGLGIQASTGGSVGIPDCVSSNGNCCAKNFIENKPKYY